MRLGLTSLGSRAGKTKLGAIANSGRVAVPYLRLPVCAALLLVAAVPSVHAQTASQIVPETYAPVVQKPGGAISIQREMSGAAPQGAEGLYVTLGGVSVEGAAVDPAELAELRARLVGKRISVAEVFAAARDLEAEHTKAGEVLTRVVVPAQDLAEGATLKLVLVEGAIESIDVSHVPDQARARVAAILAPLARQPGISISAIERKLMLASDMPGLTLHSTLLPGSATGTSLLVVDGEYRPFSLSAGFNNHMPESLGREMVSAGVDLNNLIGQGETLYLRASGDLSDSFFDDHPRNRALAAGMILPIGMDGLSLNVEGTDARTGPAPLINQVGFATHYQRLSSRLSYPLILRRALRLTGTFSFDATDEHIDIVESGDLAISHDRMRVVRLGTSLAAYLHNGGQFFGSLELSQGIDGLGARSAADASPTLPLSRAGADADFTALRFSASLDQPLVPHLAMHLNLSAQTSFGNPLVNSESFGIAQADGISPLPQGVLQGDSGYVTRAEIQAPFVPAKTGVSAVPYVFAAYGWVTLDQPTALEHRNIDAVAYGVGVRLYGSKPAPLRWLLSAEYGRAEVESVPGHPDRFSINLSFQF